LNMNQACDKANSPPKRKREDDTDTKEERQSTHVDVVAPAAVAPDAKRVKTESVDYDNMPALEQPGAFKAEMDEKKGSEQVSATLSMWEPTPVPSSYFAWVLKKAKEKGIEGKSESTYNIVMQETNGTRTKPISVAENNRTKTSSRSSSGGDGIPVLNAVSAQFAKDMHGYKNEDDTKAQPTAAAAAAAADHQHGVKIALSAAASSLSVYRVAPGKELTLLYRPPLAAEAPLRPFRSAVTAAAMISRNSPPDFNFAAIKDQIASLSLEQQAVLIAIMKGDNIFFSGAAGTGKSHLIKLLHAFLPAESTFFTAYSGLAGVNIGGTTLHSFAGVGLAEDSAEALALKVDRNKEARQRWMAAKRLIFDEASMGGADFFDKLNYVAKKVRRNSKPFGGIQMIVSGDFLQLPPIKDLKQTYESIVWTQCFQTSILLTKVFRQEGDPEFGLLLEHMRKGELSEEEEKKLIDAADHELPAINGVIPTRLHGRRKDVNADNRRFLMELPGEGYIFDAEDTHRSEPHYKLLQKECQAAQQIELRVGAQVMLLKNFDTAKGLCNGSRGVVVDFVKVGDVTDDMPCAQANDQGMDVLLNMKSSCGGYLLKDEKVPKEKRVCYLPRVRFENAEASLLTICSVKFDIQSRGIEMAARRQLPLTLAWSCTIHRSQGLTLERAVINAKDMFEEAQLYVSVSRLKSYKGLKLIGFSRPELKTNKAIAKWYEELEQETKETVKRLMNEKERYFVL
jgi:energy-coupling factor transporter ATP-binding protein EcfA2